MRSKKLGGGIYGRREECGEDGEGEEWKKKRGKDEKEIPFILAALTLIHYFIKV